MKNVKFFSLNFGTVLLRFYLMMVVVIAAGFSGYWFFGLLALPIFLSIMMGLTFNFKKVKIQPRKKKSPANMPTPASNTSSLRLG